MHACNYIKLTTPHGPYHVLKLTSTRFQSFGELAMQQGKVFDAFFTTLLSTGHEVGDAFSTTDWLLVYASPIYTLSSEYSP